MNERLTPAQAIGEFQHRNESMHRHHDLDKRSCSYCDLVGVYAVVALEREGYEIVRADEKPNGRRWWEQPDVVLSPTEQRHLDALGYLPTRMPT